MPTRIQWCDESWNPITGCSHAGSPGCDHCYAKRMAQRLKGRYGYPKDDPFRVTVHPDKYNQPAKWKKPRTIFVCSMGDLFHEDVKNEWIKSILFMMFSRGWHHTYIILTKRLERMYDFFKHNMPDYWPLPNVYLGVTCENQQAADERTPILLQIPAAVRFVSIEPMLGPVDLMPYLKIQPICKRRRECSHFKSLDWVICGAESGPGRRPAKTEWIRDLKDQCVSAGVPFFLKQMEINGKVVKMPELDGRLWDEMPKIDRGYNK